MRVGVTLLFGPPGNLMEAVNPSETAARRFRSRQVSRRGSFHLRRLTRSS
jgi:hypothetical protein